MSILPVQPIGNLVADPETRTSKSGTTYVTARMAINTGWGDRERTTFARITALDEATGRRLAAAKKGSMIQVSGELEVGAYLDKNGDPQPSVDIVVRSFAFINSGKRSEDRETAGVTSSGGGFSLDDSDELPPF